MFKNSGLGIGLLAVAASGCFAAPGIEPAVPARAAALRVIDALYLEGDVQKALQYYDTDATHCYDGPGSAVRYMRKKQLPPPKEVASLKEIVFFTERDLDRMSKRYPDLIWKRIRVPMKGGLGCVVVFEVKMRKKTIIALVLSVLKERQGKYKIVHTDDN